MPAIRESLGATLPQAQWISNAYLLPLSALILVGGAAGDRFGLARVFVAGLVVFLAASLASALSPSPEILIAARALKGVGAALVVPGSLAIIARAYPREERGRAIGIWAAASALTTAAGPVVGGAILSAGSAEAWRLIFALNLPLGAVVIWILLTRVGEDPPRETGRLDWPGALLAALALGLLAWALTRPGGANAPSPSWPLFAGSAIAGAAFLWFEARTARPMVPLGLFRLRVFSAANLATFCLYFGLSALLFYLPMTVVAAWGVGEAQVSLVFVPFTLLIAALSAPAGALSDRLGVGPLIAGGSLLVALALLLLGWTVEAMRFWAHVLPLMTLMGLGMALVVSPLSNAVMSAVEDRDTGTASGINNAVSRMAGLVAVAAMGSLAGAVYAAAGGPASFGEPAREAGHVVASNAAFRAIAWATAALAVVAAAVALAGLRPPPAQSATVRR